MSNERVRERVAEAMLVMAGIGLTIVAVCCMTLLVKATYEILKMQ